MAEVKITPAMNRWLERLLYSGGTRGKRHTPYPTYEMLHNMRALGLITIKGWNSYSNGRPYGWESYSLTDAGRAAVPPARALAARTSADA